MVMNGCGIAAALSGQELAGPDVHRQDFTCDRGAHCGAPQFGPGAAGLRLRGLHASLSLHPGAGLLQAGFGQLSRCRAGGFTLGADDFGAADGGRIIDPAIERQCWRAAGLSAARASCNGGTRFVTSAARPRSWLRR